MTVKIQIRRWLKKKYGNENMWPTRTQMASDLDIRPGTLRGWLDERVTLVDLATLEKWCVYLDVEPGDILILDE